MFVFICLLTCRPFWVQGEYSLVQIGGQVLELRAKTDLDGSEQFPKALNTQPEPLEALKLLCT